MHVEQQPLVPVQYMVPFASPNQSSLPRKIGGYNLVPAMEQMPLESLSSNQAHTLSALLIFFPVNLPNHILLVLVFLDYP